MLFNQKRIKKERTIKNLTTAQAVNIFSAKKKVKSKKRISLRKIEINDKIKEAP